MLPKVRERVQRRARNMSTLTSTKKLIYFSREYRIIKSWTMTTRMLELAITSISFLHSKLLTRCKTHSPSRLHNRPALCSSDLTQYYIIANIIIHLRY